MKFDIEGAKVERRGRFLTQVQGALDALPPGKLLTSARLASVCGLSTTYVRSFGNCLPPSYRFKDGQLMLYGHPKTIQAYVQHRRSARADQG